MNKKEIYAEYLQSEKWKVVRECAFIIHGKSCKKCGAETNLQVHHLRYPEILGNENVSEDLIVLCKECHQKVHGIETIVSEKSNIAPATSGVVYSTWADMIVRLSSKPEEAKYLTALSIAIFYGSTNKWELAEFHIKSVSGFSLDLWETIIKPQILANLDRRANSQKTKKLIGFN